MTVNMRAAVPKAMLGLRSRCLGPKCTDAEAVSQIVGLLTLFALST